MIIRPLDYLINFFWKITNIVITCFKSWSWMNWKKSAGWIKISQPTGWLCCLIPYLRCFSVFPIFTLTPRLLLNSVSTIHYCNKLLLMLFPTMEKGILLPLLLLLEKEMIHVSLKLLTVMLSTYKRVIYFFSVPWV